MDKVLKISGVPVTQLATQYGTPLYVYDENKLVEQCQSYKQNFAHPGFTTEILYASKAFSCVGMLHLIKEQGLCADVVSIGELATALEAGLDPDRIYFHGNNKTLEEINFAIEHGVYRFFVDNVQEAETLKKCIEKTNQKLLVMLRINPCIEAHTHEFIQTANIDSKFGISIYSIDEIKTLIRSLQTHEQIVFEGLHAHIGSQIFEKEAFVKEVQTMFSFISDLERDGFYCPKLDLGGGFAIHYTDQDRPIPIESICKTILDTCAQEQINKKTHVKTILIEPGRSIAGEAGSTLYTIGFSKQTPHKHYLFVDGGMSDNIRPCLYQAQYDADVATKMDSEKSRKVCIAGKCCESGDVLIPEMKLQPFSQGDLLIIYSTGAYGFSMFNNYNRNLRPAVVFVKDGKSRLIVRRESLEDLLKGDIR
ncbi:diaminopimelate decarboxylase [Faecalicoccus acidiformans]|uniref:diaminopimelate decarboxylase n=1 Tax=Faecalicoccus acidiformans TaxID=915173 RepID=UPI003207AD15